MRPGRAMARLLSCRQTGPAPGRASLLCFDPIPYVFAHLLSRGGLGSPSPLSTNPNSSFKAELRPPTPKNLPNPSQQLAAPSLSSILLQPPLTVQDDPELPAFLSLPPTRLGDWYPPTFPNTARACACAEPLLERTRCHHPGQPRQHRGCTICAKPASGRFVDRRVSPVSSDSSTSTGPSHILWIHTGAPSTSKQ